MMAIIISELNFWFLVNEVTLVEYPGRGKQTPQRDRQKQTQFKNIFGNCLPFRSTCVRLVFVLVLVGFALFNVKLTCLRVFSSVLRCPLRFLRKHDFRFTLTPVFEWDSYFIYVGFFTFIYVYWCPSRCPCQMMFVSLNSNMTGVTSGAGNVYTSGAPEFTPDFSAVRVTRSLIQYVMFCITLFVLLSFFFWPLCCLSFDLRNLITPFLITQFAGFKYSSSSDEIENILDF